MAGVPLPEHGLAAGVLVTLPDHLRSEMRQGMENARTEDPEAAMRELTTWLDAVVACIEGGEGALEQAQAVTSRQVGAILALMDIRDAARPIARAYTVDGFRAQPGNDDLRRLAARMGMA
jgi:hypothetical protein